MKTNGLKDEPKKPLPYWILAELTYRCPLQCPYCSNPLEIARFQDELDADEWCEVLSQARQLGAVQLGLSGGEPLLKPGLARIVQHAHKLGFYTNLITSGVGLTHKSIQALKKAGLDHIQLSLQAPEANLNNRIAGRDCFEQKMQAAALIKAFHFPMVLNVVLHRQNIDRLRDIIELAMELRADYLELANVQFDGWAFINRNALLPTREQVDKALEISGVYQEKLKQQMQILYVLPDYFSTRPKPCCAGWGKLSMVVNPAGVVLPCLGAHKLPIAERPHVRKQSLAWIWEKSALFNAFRGYAWMKEPCRTCPERFKDFGGCRCQAYLLTGDAAQTDPVCSLSPYRATVDEALSPRLPTSSNEMIPRSFLNSKRME